MQRPEFLESIETVFEDVFLGIITEITSGKFEVQNPTSSLKRSVSRIKTINRLSSTIRKDSSKNSSSKLA